MDIVVKMTTTLVDVVKDGEEPDWKTLQPVFNEVAHYIETSEEFQQTIEKLDCKTVEYSEMIDKGESEKEKLYIAWSEFMTELSNNPTPKFIVMFYVVMIPLISTCINNYLADD